MPPKGARLTEAEVATLKCWIDEGRSGQLRPLQRPASIPGWTTGRFNQCGASNRQQCKTSLGCGTKSMRSFWPGSNEK